MTNIESHDAPRLLSDEEVAGVGGAHGTIPISITPPSNQASSFQSSASFCYRNFCVFF